MVKNLSPTNKKVKVRCNVSIVNFQPAPAIGFVELTDVRIWSTNVYSCIFLNEFARQNIEKYIKEGMISNGQSSSSWRFKRFSHVNIQVRSDNILLSC